MNTTTADWTHIEPLLDEAMDALGNADRTAVLLRYFEFVICISIAGLTVPLSFTENAGRQLQKRFSIWRSRRSSTGQIAL